MRDESLTRAFGPTYQNLTGRPMVVLIAFSALRASAIMAYAYLQACVDLVTPATDPVAYAGLQNMDNVAEHIEAFLAFFVPHGCYYQCNEQVTVGGSLSLTTWYEIEL